MDLPRSNADHLLFNSSTTITLGDDAKTCFWHNNWLEGEAPKFLAPNLFQLATQKIEECSRNFKTTFGCTP
jgi:hypothetical protein